VVPSGTDVFIIAKCLVECGYTSRCRVARIVGAGIVIRTFHLAGSLANTILAEVQFGAGIAIITSQAGQVRVHTPHHGVTGIPGTQIVIVAFQFNPNRTPSHRVATLVSGANIVVIADQRHAGDTTQGRVATFKPVADTAVIALQLQPAKTLPVNAHVLGSTDIPVAARSLVVDVSATGFRFTGIISTWIPIIAVDRNTARAKTFQTFGSKGTGIGIVAQESIVVRNQRTIPRRRFTMGLQAEGIVTFRIRAMDNGIRINSARIGPVLLVTHQRSVAQVRICKSLNTLLVTLAFATHRCALAFAFKTLVSDSARVGIIAGLSVFRILTTTGFRTDIIGTRITVIALHRVTETGPGHAVIGHGTGIGITAIT
jgi:hypothetical protein